MLELKAKFIDTEKEEISIKKERRTEFFKTQFKDMSIQELERKLNTEHLTDEAKKAIMELLQVK